MNNKTKILVGILIIIIIVIGGWVIFKSKEVGKRIEIKGKLEIVEAVSPLFNKECLNNDFKVGSYYLKGLCKKPYLAASLGGIIGEEIEVKGVVKKVEALEVIEVEEITPPEIIMIITETSRYQPGEKITIHLKHYLKKSVLSYFGTENPTCAIESIEKKNEEWEKLTSWTNPADCNQITLKEIKPYHLSGEFSMLEWQPLSLEPGQYRLKFVYKLSEGDEWKTIYSNEFIILKPELVTGCKVGRGDREAEKKFHKVVISEVKWDNYENFLVEEITIRYGYGPSPIFEGGPLTQKLISKDGEVIAAFKTHDLREVTIMCEIGADCPPPQFLKEGEQTMIDSLAFYLVTSGGREFIEANDIRFIELYEREKLPEWVFPEGKTFPGYKPGELLLRVDLSECMKKFCDEVALENDPSCVGEYYSPSTMIKGKITDHLGNPVKNVHIDFGEKTTTRGCTGSEYTDGNGDYIINECYQPSETKLIEGNYWLAIYPPFKLNLKSESKEVNLKKSEIKILNIPLKQCGSITGKITDKEGNSLTEAWVYEIGFETPRHHVCEMSDECELGTFVIPYLAPGNYKIGAEVKIGEKYIELPSKEVKVELGKTAIVNFVLEK